MGVVEIDVIGRAISDIRYYNIEAFAISTIQGYVGNNFGFSSRTAQTAVFSGQLCCEECGHDCTNSYHASSQSDNRTKYLGVSHRLYTLNLQCCQSILGAPARLFIYHAAHLADSASACCKAVCTAAS